MSTFGWNPSVFWCQQGAFCGAQEFPDSLATGILRRLRCFNVQLKGNDHCHHRYHVPLLPRLCAGYICPSCAKATLLFLYKLLAQGGLLLICFVSWCNCCCGHGLGDILDVYLRLFDARWRLRLALAGADVDNFWQDNVDTASAWKIYPGAPHGAGSSTIVRGSSLLVQVAA